MRYFITLSYDGTRYHGWQVQPNGISVQGCLQQALNTLLRQPIEVTGAGRTDAGVHASMMVAHFDLIDNCELRIENSSDRIHNSQLVGETSQFSILNSQLTQLTYRLNKILPPDIAVQKVEPVSDDLHARFSATSRTYHYFVHLPKSPFRRAYSWQLFGQIDFQRMNEAAAMLPKYTDFTSFSKVNTDTKTNLCTIHHARWEELEPGVWRFEIQANRFLRNMVRAIVGTLLEVGRGRMSVDDFCRVIESKNRCSAGESVPGHALFLVDIQYPQ